jgi:hypothetical protein
MVGGRVSRQTGHGMSHFILALEFLPADQKRRRRRSVKKTISL